MLLINQDFITENLTVRFTIPVISVIFKNSAAITNMRSGPYMEFSIIDFFFEPFPSVRCQMFLISINSFSMFLNIY